MNESIGGVALVLMAAVVAWFVRYLPEAREEAPAQGQGREAEDGRLRRGGGGDVVGGGDPGSGGGGGPDGAVSVVEVSGEDGQERDEQSGDYGRAGRNGRVPYSGVSRFGGDHRADEGGKGDERRSGARAGAGRGDRSGGKRARAAG